MLFLGLRALASLFFEDSCEGVELEVHAAEILVVILLLQFGDAHVVVWFH